MAKAKSKKSAAQPRWAHFSVGRRVKVLGGDYGNSRGVIDTAADGNSHILVLLDQEAHTGPRKFHAKELELL